MTDSALPPAPPEPPRNADVSALAPGFQYRLGLTLKDANTRCAQRGLKYRFEVFEGLRTSERQEWLFGSGRTYHGPWLTNAESAESSWHGFGLAADCVPRPIHSDAHGDSLGDFTWDGPSELWQILHDAVINNGCVTGLRWERVDADHVQVAGLRISPSIASRQAFATGGLEAVWTITGMGT